jgi:hypothetical protein
MRTLQVPPALAIIERPPTYVRVRSDFAAAAPPGASKAINTRKVVDARRMLRL